jgi:hypothetical protein
MALIEVVRKYLSTAVATTEGILNAAIELRMIRVRVPLLYRRVLDGAPREAGSPLENDTKLVKRKGDHGSF